MKVLLAWVWFNPEKCWFLTAHPTPIEPIEIAAVFDKPNRLFDSAEAQLIDFKRDQRFK